jgi:hypothetical protein
MMYTVEMDSCGMIHIPSCTNIGAGVQERLKFCIINLRGSNVGITDRRDL